MLERDLVFRFESWPEIRVPAGFVTDLASIPKLAETVRSRVGTYNRAAIVHDWLYWTGLCTREEADRIFYRAMRTSGGSDAVAGQVYWAVRLGGSWAFDENAADREAEANAPGSGDRRIVDLTSGDGSPLAALDDYYWPGRKDALRPDLMKKLRMLASPSKPARPAWCDMGIDPKQKRTPREYLPRRARR